MKLITTALILILSITGSFAQLFDKQEGFTRKDSLRGELSAFRSCYDVNYYDLKVKVDILLKRIDGSNSIYYTAVNDFKTLQIDLAEKLTITNIYFEEKPLKFDREFDAVFVHFTEKQMKGAKGIIRVEYGGMPQIAKNAPWDGGFSFTADKQGYPWVGISCQGLGASVWWPNKDHLSDEPDSMLIRAVVPADLKCIANGNLRAEMPDIPGFKEYDWFVGYPINNYNVTLNIGRYTHLEDVFTSADGEKLAIDYYVLDYNAEVAKKHFEQVKPMLTCYEKYLGKYPFYKDGYALVETPYLGMEHQSAIAYGNQYNTGYMGFDYSGIGLDFDYIIIHESVHEWWGNNVSVKDIADLWVHEGFATYSETIYVECMFDYQTAMNYLTAMKSNINNNAPIIGKYQVNNEGSPDMYQKSALMLNTLRTLTDNDELWWSIIAGLQKDYALETVTSQQIENYISRKAGKDFSKEFDQYLRRSKLPVFEYSLNAGAGGLAFKYRWVTPDKEFIMPMRYVNEKGEFIWIRPTSQWQSLNLTGVSLAQFKLDEEHFYFEGRMVKP